MISNERKQLRTNQLFKSAMKHTMAKKSPTQVGLSGTDQHVLFHFCPSLLYVVLVYKTFFAWHWALNLNIDDNSTANWTCFYWGMNLHWLSAEAILTEDWSCTLWNEPVPSVDWNCAEAMEENIVEYKFNYWSMKHFPFAYHGSDDEAFILPVKIKLKKDRSLTANSK